VNKAIKGDPVKKLPRVPSRTTLGFAFSILDRALREGLLERKFGKDEVAEVCEWFTIDGELECVFCGSRDVMRWDHLVPVRYGGSTVLGNMVPSCQPCDDSKQHYDFEEWMMKSTKGSLKARGVVNIKARIKKLKRYQEKYNFHPKDVDNLIPEQISKKIAKLRKELELFLNVS